MRNRYGGGPTAAPVAPVVAAPVTAAPARRGPETILDERPLKITLYVEAVTIPVAKPKPLK
jgi:hypothetical protein